MDKLADRTHRNSTSPDKEGSTMILARRNQGPLLEVEHFNGLNHDELNLRRTFFRSCPYGDGERHDRISTYGIIYTATGFEILCAGDWLATDSHGAEHF